MRGPCGPRKSLKAAQTIIIGISEPMFWVIRHNHTPVPHSFYITQVTFLGSMRTPHIKKRKFFFYIRMRVNRIHIILYLLFLIMWSVRPLLGGGIVDDCCNIFFSIVADIGGFAPIVAGFSPFSLFPDYPLGRLIRQRALRKRNFVAMGFVMKVLWQDHTFVMKCTLNALCLLSILNIQWYPVVFLEYVGLGVYSTEEENTLFTSK